MCATAIDPSSCLIRRTIDASRPLLPHQATAAGRKKGGVGVEVSTLITHVGREWLNGMTTSKVRWLERSFAHLGPRQVAFVHETPTRARIEQCWAADQLNILEGLFEKWRNHNMAGRFAIIGIVISLFDSPLLAGTYAKAFCSVPLDAGLSGCGFLTAPRAVPGLLCMRKTRKNTQ